MAGGFFIDDELWAEVEPLIPRRPRRTCHTGRKPLPDRAVLNGILHVLRTGIAWEDLPQELGYGSGVTCWRRVRDWQREGAWDTVCERLQSRLDAAGTIDWSRVARSRRHYALL